MQNASAIRSGFRVLENAEELQTAVMVLDPGEQSGPFGNEHASSEQVLLVLDGDVEAEIDGKRFSMRRGDSVIVPKNAPHRFVNRSRERATTFNVYSPKAY